MACILKDFEARQLEVDEDEQLEVVEEEEEDWDPQDELIVVERQASSGHDNVFGWNACLGRGKEHPQCEDVIAGQIQAVDVG
ncbi:unnamed protein product [Heligmosomoides polygyrus]|uniref:Uncharacterized protein n=1 Tax=Heligmosomoides polygyrus TaxID=6339 RepID=A0A183FZ93_HELPZ|nr:unnamed protein product [Heligmosomoides polygyrus]